MTVVQGICGLFVFVAVAWMFSENRTKVSPKMIMTGITVQLVVGLLLLKLPIFQQLFLSLNAVVLALAESTEAGTSLVFGYLGGGPLPFEAKAPGNVFIFGFRSMPLVLVINALSSLLFFWGLLPRVVKGFAWCLTKTFRIGGTEGLALAANVFVGMVEAPLLIRPYLTKMTRSELFTVMTAGMATIAGTVMVLYVSILGNVIDGAAGHILTASIISMPAAVIISKIMIPETSSLTIGDLHHLDENTHNSMDAVTQGALQGVRLLVNILAMMVVLVALVHLVNSILGLIPLSSDAPLTLQRIFSYGMAPVVWLMGVPWSEALTAGALMGTKSVLNEFIAYLDLAGLAPEALSEKSKVIMTYALCGFANPGSLGIMISGLGTVAPERRDEIVGLGFRSFVAGILATSMTGAVVGILQYEYF
jgi:CNT family concentrative nucleoside transporter